MNNIEELEKAKIATQTAQQQCWKNGGALGAGQIGGGLSEPAQPGIRERIAMNLGRAQQEARRAEALHELQYLLEKNPEIARILDLLEAAQILRA